MLLERAQAAVHGVASGVDDHIGQDRLDKPGVGLLGILSVKRGAPARCRWVCSRYCSECLRHSGQVELQLGSYAGIGLGEVWAIMEISGSSLVPSTMEWLARICSSRVEPERGRPTMKVRPVTAPLARPMFGEIVRAENVAHFVGYLGSGRRRWYPATGWPGVVFGASS